MTRRLYLITYERKRRKRGLESLITYLQGLPDQRADAYAVRI